MIVPSMHDQRPTRDTTSLEEATISNIWEILSLWSCWSRRVSVPSKTYIPSSTSYAVRPRTRIPETAFPESYLLTETEDKIIDDILKLLNTHGITSHQSLSLLERLGRIIEMGQRAAGPRDGCVEGLYLEWVRQRAKRISYSSHPSTNPVVYE
jgi:hypothetical protein